MASELNPLEVKSWRSVHRKRTESILLESDLPARNPFKFFDAWFKIITSQSDLSLEEINAFALSTTDRDGQPSSRMVLLRVYSKEGFTFFTNYQSKKGRHLDENPKAAMLFFWPKIDWQIRIEGIVEKLPSLSSDDYWYSRPVDNRINAIVSQQSTVISSRDYLTKKVAELSKQFEGQDLRTAFPRPENWGGYILRPRMFEFWQGQTDRLHDRIRFQLAKDVSVSQFAHSGEDGWLYERLSP